MMNPNVKCPTCGGDIFEIDAFDIDVENGKIILYKVGECDHCGNHYQWTETYTFESHSSLEYTDSESEYEPDDLECGFDPYCGCYTDDC